MVCCVFLSLEHTTSTESDVQGDCCGVRRATPTGCHGDSSSRLGCSCFSIRHWKQVSITLCATYLWLVYTCTSVELTLLNGLGKYVSFAIHCMVKRKSHFAGVCWCEVTSKLIYRIPYSCPRAHWRQLQ